ncbi:unnamed protein product, partial [Bubo scandiacus]
MESTEKCEAVITHFNGKYIKTPRGCQVGWGVPGRLGGGPVGRQMALAAPPHSSPGPAALQVRGRGAEEAAEPGQVRAQRESLGPGRRHGHRDLGLRPRDGAAEWVLPGALRPGPQPDDRPHRPGSVPALPPSPPTRSTVPPGCTSRTSCSPRARCWPPLWTTPSPSSPPWWPPWPSSSATSRWAAPARTSPLPPPSPEPSSRRTRRCRPRSRWRTAAPPRATAPSSRRPSPAPSPTPTPS